MPMARYVIELYRPSSGAESLRGAADRLAESARQLSREGNPVRYLDTIFLPTDETCLHLFEARCEADVRAVAKRAGIDVDRVVPAEQIEPCGTSSLRTTPERKARDDQADHAAPGPQPPRARLRHRGGAGATTSLPSSPARQRETHRSPLALAYRKGR